MDVDWNFSITKSLTSSRVCEGTNMLGLYSHDSTVGMVYLCPVCRRVFHHHPVWSMDATSSQAVFVVPSHSG